jgi:hypothetical protein
LHGINKEQAINNVPLNIICCLSHHDLEIRLTAVRNGWIRSQPMFGSVHYSVSVQRFDAILVYDRGNNTAYTAAHWPSPRLWSKVHGCIFRRTYQKLSATHSIETSPKANLLAVPCTNLVTATQIQNSKSHVRRRERLYQLVPVQNSAVLREVQPKKCGTIE